MRKKTAIIITLIITFLILNGVLFGWMMKQQAQDNEQKAAQAAQAAGKEISAAALRVSEEAERASEKAEAEAARLMAAEHVYAHRDVSGEALEHSFKAYDQAIADGAVNIEQDIVISKDGTLYLSHDLTAARMTGDSRAFAEMTHEEIDQLRTHAGEKTLRLSEVFDRYGTSIEYVIELKSADLRTIDAFSQIVDQYGFADRIVVQCFDLETLKNLEERYPDMPKLYLCQYPQYLNQGYEAPYVDIISAQLTMMTEENVKRAHDMGKQFSAWPLVHEDEFRKAIDLGVDTYFTDDVKLAMSLEESYGFQVRQ